MLIYFWLVFLFNFFSLLWFCPKFVSINCCLPCTIQNQGSQFQKGSRCRWPKLQVRKIGISKTEILSKPIDTIRDVSIRFESRNVSIQFETLWDDLRFSNRLKSSHNVAIRIDTSRTISIGFERKPVFEKPLLRPLEQWKRNALPQKLVASWTIKTTLSVVSDQIWLGPFGRLSVEEI